MSETATKAPETLAGDLLEGAPAIAMFLGKSKRQVDWLLEKGQLPGAFKLGGKWHLRRSAFLAHIAQLETTARNAAA